MYIAFMGECKAMEKELFEFLNKEVPNSLRDIREVLDLLVTTMDGTIDEIGKGVSECYNNKDFEKSIKFVSYSKEVDELNKKVQDILLQIDNILDENEEDDISQNTEKQIPNYSDFLVDSKQEHTLYEDFTHTRPCAFKIENQRIEVREWKGMELLLRSVAMTKRKLNPSLKIDGILITRVDKRNNLSGQIIKMVRDAYESLNIFDSQIPERIAVGKSLSKHELVAGFEKNSDAAIAYKKLAQEVLAK